MGPGDDRYYGSFYVGPEWSDNVWGGPGDDILEGRAGQDYLSGGPGNDSIWGHNGVDFLVGGEDDDVLNGGNGDDQLEGGAGADTLFGGAREDALWGNKRPTYGSLWGVLESPDYTVDQLSGGDGTDAFHAAYYTYEILLVGSFPLTLKVYLEQDVMLDFVGPNHRNPSICDSEIEYFLGPQLFSWSGSR